MRRVVLAHGGTGSTPELKDGTDEAVHVGMKVLREKDPLAAVVAAVTVLEDDERFNAGTGSLPRFDGKTVEMDAAVMDSRRNYGAVSAIRAVKNPVQIARAVLDTPNNIVTGEGATRFARALGHAHHDPLRPHAVEKWRELVEKIMAGEDSVSDNEWEYEALRKCWNYPTPFEEVFPRRWKPRKGSTSRTGATDTVGAVATDGKSFAAAASTGGTIATLLGRVGDSPSTGAGIFAGECGCIAITGNGDHILRDRSATLVHEWLMDGFSAEAAVRRLSARYSGHTDVFAVVIGLEDHMAGGNREIAWSLAEES